MSVYITLRRLELERRSLLASKTTALGVLFLGVRTYMTLHSTGQRQLFPS